MAIVGTLILAQDEPDQIILQKIGDLAPGSPVAHLFAPVPYTRIIDLTILYRVLCANLAHYFKPSYVVTRDPWPAAYAAARQSNNITIRTQAETVMNSFEQDKTYQTLTAELEAGADQLYEELHIQLDFLTFISEEGEMNYMKNYTAAAQEHLNKLDKEKLVTLSETLDLQYSHIMASLASPKKPVDKNLFEAIHEKSFKGFKSFAAAKNKQKRDLHLQFSLPTYRLMKRQVGILLMGLLSIGSAVGAGYSMSQYSKLSAQMYGLEQENKIIVESFDLFSANFQAIDQKLNSLYNATKLCAVSIKREQVRTSYLAVVQHCHTIHLLLMNLLRHLESSFLAARLHKLPTGLSSTLNLKQGYEKITQKAIQYGLGPFSSNYLFMLQFEISFLSIKQQPTILIEIPLSRQDNNFEIYTLPTQTIIVNNVTYEFQPEKLKFSYLITSPDWKYFTEITKSEFEKCRKFPISEGNTFISCPFLTKSVFKKDSTESCLMTLRKENFTNILETCPINVYDTSAPRVLALGGAKFKILPGDSDSTELSIFCPRAEQEDRRLTVSEPYILTLASGCRFETDDYAAFESHQVLASIENQKVLKPLTADELWKDFELPDVNSSSNPILDALKSFTETSPIKKISLKKLKNLMKEHSTFGTVTRYGFIFRLEICLLISCIIFFIFICVRMLRRRALAGRLRQNDPAGRPPVQPAAIEWQPGVQAAELPPQQDPLGRRLLQPDNPVRGQIQEL